MKNHFRALFFFAFFFLPGFLAIVPRSSWGVSANPTEADVSQLDGTKIKIFLRGDEFYSWNEDDDGYTIVKDTGSKEWVYATRDARGALDLPPFTEPLLSC